MSDLNELADRVEALDGPSREIDALIHCITMPYCEMPSRNDAAENSGYVLFRGKDFRQANRYTKSLDTAMSLVPEGCDRADHVWPDAKGKFCTYLWERGANRITARSRATTPALALVAASLRAIHLQGEG